MRVINALNVNDAFIKGYNLLMEGGEKQNSRAGPVIVYPEPVTTVYALPQERVLFHSVRDANPAFHLMESLWMLAGRNNARWLDQFVSDFSARFAEDDGHQHGAYGFRWRQHFELEGGGFPIDQLETIINLLRTNSEDRRIVLTMWDPMADLGAVKRDVPCNTQAYFRIHDNCLNMLVCCRSNDMWWGAYGANAVHFSVLQEYLAARIGVKVGTYEQMSFNFHLYPAVVRSRAIQKEASYGKDGPQITQIVTDPEHFDSDLQQFMSDDFILNYDYKNQFFPNIAVPLKSAYTCWRNRRYDQALKLLEWLPEHSDWRVAIYNWFQRRMSKVREKENAGS